MPYYMSLLPYIQDGSSILCQKKEKEKRRKKINLAPATEPNRCPNSPSVKNRVIKMHFGINFSGYKLSFDHRIFFFIYI